MTPELKAKELVENMLSVLYKEGSETDKNICIGYAKECALVTVEEIMITIAVANYRTWYNEQMNLGYWQQVKEEIKSL